MPDSRRRAWTLAIVSVGLFMVVLDNLVVSVALPSIHRDLGASIQSLEWTVNAYTLSYAVLPAHRGGPGRPPRAQADVPVRDRAVHRCPRRRRAGAEHRRPDRRPRRPGHRGRHRHPADPDPAGRGLSRRPPRHGDGVWSAISGIAVALGPLVGGAVVQAASWHWIFWINVPIGLVLVPLAGARLVESRGPNATLDLGGLALGSTGLFGIVYGLVRSQSLGWTAPRSSIALIAGVVLVGAFIA